MVNQHAGHTATLLPGGLVLVAGGALSVSVYSTMAADLYTPRDGLFYNFPELTQRHPRGSTATLLPGPGEDVLFVGGAYGSAELWNFSNVTALDFPYPVSNQTATLLANGKVLIAGGLSNGDSVASAELFDPATDMFTATGSMGTPRAYHSATLLANGKVLIAGGRYQCCVGVEPYGVTLQSAELYDPSTGTFSPVGNMVGSREQHSATLLNDGTVLVAGGLIVLGPSEPDFHSRAEIYDPGSGKFLWVSNMSNARYDHTATLLPNGQVLIAGGTNSVRHDVYHHAGNALATSEIYDPATRTFTSSGSMTYGRYLHRATMLDSGVVLITGGYDWSGTPIYSTELYHP
jgi:hypothetical protein